MNKTKFNNVKTIQLLVFAKSIDGGTGTFLYDFLTIKTILPGSITLKALVLEKPSFSKIKNYKFEFFTDENFYPEKYQLSIKNFVNTFKELVWFNKQVNQINPNLVITIDSHCMLLMGIVNLINNQKFKTITTIHNNLFDVLQVKSDKYLRKLIIPLMSFFLRRSNQVVCVSKDLSKNFQKVFELDVPPKSIPHGILVNKKARPHKYPKNGSFTLVSIARFSEQKDHKTLLESFKLILRKRPQTKLILVGDGPLKEKIIETVNELDIQKSVSILGWIDDPVRILQRSDIFILSSKREGFGYVILEAMAQGLPIVTTDSPFGPAEVIGYGKYGMLVPVSDGKSLSNAILKLINDKKTYNKFAEMSIARCGNYPLIKMLNNYKNIVVQNLK